MPETPSRLQRDLKQNRPFPSVAQEAMLSLFKTVDDLRRGAIQVLEPEGITLQQYNVLRILRGAGAEGLPTLEIVTRMIEQAPGITRLLDRLERKKLVHRERCPTDRRQVTCRITEPGLGLLARLDAVVDRTNRHLLGGLTTAEQRQLIQLLDQVREGLPAG
ncbi:MAG TPA: MarR family transcriptional regulator [Gemmatimonadales bacterium]|nr:MarR family transcriptional regulator [Gemmatimonadales bacterium]